MGERMTKDQDERLVVAYELIGKALEGLHEAITRAGKRYWPEPREQREVISTHILTEEEKIRERQGHNKPIEEWLTNLPEDDEPIGERTRQWYADHPPEKAKVVDASPKASSKGKTGRTGVKEVEGKTGTPSDGSTNNSTSKKGPQRRSKNRS